MDGFETFKRLREIQPSVPIILMTGFGWDPTHSIVKARQEGLQTVLYKPFRADRLMEAVEQALRSSPTDRLVSPPILDGKSAAAPVIPPTGATASPRPPADSAPDGARLGDSATQSEAPGSQPVEASHHE
jgi:DNA-binding response OmpR family regulator